MGTCIKDLKQTVMGQGEYVIYSNAVGNFCCGYLISSGELEEVRKKSSEHDKVIESKDGLKQMFDEILQTVNSRDSLLEEFDEEIFNALVEKIEILTPAHFVFELKSGLRVEEIEE